jgi:hypothetical protein
LQYFIHKGLTGCNNIALIFKEFGMVPAILMEMDPNNLKQLKTYIKKL